MRIPSLCLTVVILCVVPNHVQAELVHKVEASHSDNAGTVLDIDTDEVQGPPITNSIFAEITSPNTYSSSASVGPFGNLGVQASQFVAGEVRTFVRIASDENINNSGVPQSATANFIVDGGEISMLAGQGASLRLLLTIDSTVSVNGNPVSFRTWQGGYTVEPRTPFGPISFTQINRPLDAFIDPNNSNRIEIPFSFQSFDLGVIPNGGVIDLEYTLDISTELPSAPEGVFWEFSDPLDVDGFGESPTVEFTAIAEPSQATCGLVAMVVVLVFRKRLGGKLRG